MQRLGSPPGVRLPAPELRELGGQELRAARSYRGWMREPRVLWLQCAGSWGGKRPARAAVIHGRRRRRQEGILGESDGGERDEEE